MKTAGTSVEMALSKICGPEDIITPISYNDERKRLELGIRGSQNYFVPFRKYTKIDWLKFILKFERKRFYNHILAEEVQYLIGEAIWNSYFKFCFERNPYDKTISLYYFRDGDKKYGSIKKFISKGGLNEIKGIDLYSINKLVAVDKVYQFGKIAEALKDIQFTLGLKETIELPNFRAKSSTRKDKRNHNEVLSDEEKEIIELIFQREIKLFNYH